MIVSHVQLAYYQGGGLKFRYHFMITKPELIQTTNFPSRGSGSGRPPPSFASDLESIHRYFPS